jgi:hypothetical protein
MFRNRMAGFPYLDLSERKSMSFFDYNDPVFNSVSEKALEGLCHGGVCLASTDHEDSVIVRELELSLTNRQGVILKLDVPKDRFLWIDCPKGSLKNVMGLTAHSVQG